MMWMPTVLCSLSLCLLVDALGCLNPRGKPVDWYVVYKLPQISYSPKPLIAAGLGHFYLDGEAPYWVLSTASLNGSGQAIYNTLSQIYKAQKDDIVYAMYNDEKPTGEKTEHYGHTKGVIGFDKSAGFWLVHSTPKFPPAQTDGYDWPHSALVYGQSFLCVTYEYRSLDSIGAQLHFNYPWVYDFGLPASFKGDNPSLTAYLSAHQKPHPTSPPFYHLAPLVSRGGQHFLSFAKFTDFNQDLYSAWVAPYFRTDLETETWQNGAGKLPSNCTSKLAKVYNVKAISLPGGVSFKETKDHSKWAVTVATANSAPWICIGDINRQEHQMERGGGTVCFQHQAVHDQFSKAVTDIEKC